MRGGHRLVFLALVHAKHGFEHQHHELARPKVIIKQNDLVKLRPFGLCLRARLEDRLGHYISLASDQDHCTNTRHVPREFPRRRRCALLFSGYVSSAASSAAETLYVARRVRGGSRGRLVTASAII